MTAPRTALFQSYVQGGFECSSHRLASGRRLDVLAATGHDRNAAADYAALRDVDPRARFVHCEPLIAVHHDPATGRPPAEAQDWHEAQFQAFDLILGAMWPQIGGAPGWLDVMGLNYYPHNQWVHGGGKISRDHPAYRPLGDLLCDAHARYGRPILIAETGTEGPSRASWFTYVAAQAERARQRGVPVEGICLYPVVDHLGWDDDRYCPNGLLGLAMRDGQRAVEPDLLREVLRVTGMEAGLPKRAYAG